MPSPYVRFSEVHSTSWIRRIFITHGTDALEETAYMLELISPCKQPIILTRAMKLSTDFSSDGPANLLNAIRVAIHPKAEQLGVAVVRRNS